MYTATGTNRKAITMPRDSRAIARPNAPAHERSPRWRRARAIAGECSGRRDPLVVGLLASLEPSSIQQEEEEPDHDPEIQVHVEQCRPGHHHVEMLGGDQQTRDERPH